MSDENRVNEDARTEVVECWTTCWGLLHTDTVDGRVAHEQLVEPNHQYQYTKGRDS